VLDAVEARSLRQSVGDADHKALPAAKIRKHIEELRRERSFQQGG